MIGGGDWGEDRLVPDIMRAALAGEQVRVRNPNSIRPWQHVLNPLSGYLVLAQALWDSPEHAAGWNFGPADEDARPVGWIVERMGELWPAELRWAVDDGPHPHEARYLKLDSSRARARLGWRPPVGLDAALAEHRRVVSRAARRGRHARRDARADRGVPVRRGHLAMSLDVLSILRRSRRSRLRGPWDVAVGQLLSAA